MKYSFDKKFHFISNIPHSPQVKERIKRSRKKHEHGRHIYKYGNSFIDQNRRYSRRDGDRDITHVENNKNTEDRENGFLVFRQVNRWLSKVFGTFDGLDLLLMTTNYSEKF